MNPNFPIYIVSKGRANNGLTWKALDEMGVPYDVIVEPEEYDDYAKVIDPSRLMECPQHYKDTYDTFWPSKTTGPGAARNYAWHDSISRGFTHHWVMDDNLDAFHRLNRNVKAEVTSGTIFKCMEDFTLRYNNVAISGPNYYSFVKSTDKVQPYILNTRIYSCLLIKNNIQYRWRGKYNEDTDLCLRVLKDGWCTIQFNAFLQGKTTTQRMTGGNHEQFYSKEGTMNKSKMLQEMHPDVAKVSWRFNRWHHQVNYKPFRANKLQKKDMVIPKGINNYGMKLKIL
jgi:hypothetical protein